MAAAHELRQLPGLRDDALAMLSDVERRLSGVGRVLPDETWLPTRLNAHYYRALNLACLVLRAESAPQLRAGGLSLRLRAALHVGLVDDEHPVTAGISAATNDVSRLLDCEPLRMALRDSDPDVTFAAMIVSAEAFDMFVRGGHTGLPPSRFTKVRAQVKQFDRTAYLYVPVPSHRAPGDEPSPGAAPDNRCPPRPAACRSATYRLPGTRHRTSSVIRSAAASGRGGHD